MLKGLKYLRGIIFFFFFRFRWYQHSVGIRCTLYMLYEYSILIKQYDCVESVQPHNIQKRTQNIHIQRLPDISMAWVIKTYHTSPYSLIHIHLPQIYRTYRICPALRGIGTQWCFYHMLISMTFFSLFNARSFALSIRKHITPLSEQSTS